ncbi:conserved hypothetical protein [Bosea sp. 62]|jgi:hypothetical protein|uniref:hypothetical protein n=1 Tax=unclassified Bosea (in: a-proteobacteria) TaxID=2653178 RepID=UPI0012563CB9|nr:MULTISPECIES: hypothetical protein [unclassified Bosea (in: a-proteobacteria)]MDP3257472.1 hypothetical protein [Bosea sp. (in: a-proteobacteria)]CAD5274622.1 conserved hypothetical protein [Bosea sp. 7B]CAD5290438.1 conserved hypothetical protein [Bosea sp. 21B]VVT60688.1 conserved hypothetical protein [Bosea sp. EC-HK365B]VXB53740.1 conserved hypothetical protein [Bosea sp. 127]
MKSRNGALAIALVVLAVLFYAVSVVRMREVEDRRHQADPKAHASGAPALSPRP